MKNSGIEWIGEIPDDWEVSKIGQLYEERKTKVSDTVYPPLSVTMQGIIPQLETAAKSDAHDDRKLVLKGDFAINSRSDRRGSCGISEFDGSVSLINTVLHPKTEMNPIYYNWLFHSFRFSDEYYKNGHGIVDDLWTTSWTEMKKIFIPLPPKETQQRIATYLDKKCNKIEETIQNQQQVIEKLKAYKQSLITEAVTGKVKIENGKACGEYESYKDSGVEWIGKIPSGWEVKKLKYIADSFSKGSGITKEEIVINGDIPCVRYGELYTKYDYHFTECQTRTNLGIIETPKYFSHGDVLFTCTGELVEEIGKSIAYLGNEKCLAGGDIIVLKHSQDPMFMGFALDSKYVQGQKSFGKTKLKVVHISSGEIARLLIVLPPKEEQKEIADYLDKKCTAIDTAIEQKQKLIEKLTEYKKSLIYECVTGKKAV
ncbi:MAG: restriction endonuclease subunit S [Treponema sp.]|nr:restriction endonuclease subunit S [Treponema sp.]